MVTEYCELMIKSRQYFLKIKKSYSFHIISIHQAYFLFNFNQIGIKFVIQSIRKIHFLNFSFAIIPILIKSNISFRSQAKK
jgi:hypothetical protein